MLWVNCECWLQCIPLSIPSTCAYILCTFSPGPCGFPLGFPVSSTPGRWLIVTCELCRGSAGVPSRRIHASCPAFPGQVHNPPDRDQRKRFTQDVGMNVNTLELTFQLGAPGKSEAICSEVEVFQILWQNAVVFLKVTEAHVYPYPWVVNDISTSFFFFFFLTHIILTCSHDRMHRFSAGSLSTNRTSDTPGRLSGDVIKKKTRV